MTYEEHFEKCETVFEAHVLYKRLIANCNSDLDRWGCDIAYRKRVNEIRKQYEEHCYG